jgi:hypothetical protein
MSTKSQKPQVDSHHQQYDDKLPQWTMIRDVVNGEQAVKSKGEYYLPRPNPEDKSAEADERYKQYKMRAVLFNATGRTLEGLVGHVFQKESVAVLTPRLELIKKNIDGTGQTLEQLAKLLLSRVLSYGRAGLLADYPLLPEGKTVATVADLDSGNIRPKLVSYSPFKVINWRTVEVGAQALLSLVVLEEEYATSDDGFASEVDVQYRVLRLTQATPGTGPYSYTVELWRKDTGNDAWSIVDGYPITPVDSKGKPFAEIPFKFIGWQENTPNVNSAPLFDLASLNIHHYMTEADYRESVFICGQPTPVFTGLTKDWVKDVFPNGKIMLGSRAAVPLPLQATAMLLQAQPNTMAKEALTDLEEKMVALGAQLVQQHEVQRTATESRNDRSMSVSVLSSSANNVSEGVSQALVWAGQFIGEEDDGKGGKICFTLSTDFDLSQMTAQERAQLLAEWQANGITTEEYRFNITAAGVGYEDFEEYKSQLEEDKALFPPAPMLDPATGLPMEPAKPAKPDGTKPDPAKKAAEPKNTDPAK